MSEHATTAPEPAHDVPGHQEHHVVPLRVYYLVFAALMVLTLITVEVAHFDLGHPEILSVRIPMNVVVALLIAITKASLVVLFFMHVKYSPRMVRIVVIASLAWLSLLLTVVADYLSRGWLGNPGT